MKKTVQKISRYPGIRAFEKNERHVFFGRKKEAKKLFAQVKAKSLVVLFAKSGIGKSSLLNAGVVPLLEEDIFQAVNIRLQNTGVDPIEMVKNELKPFHQAKELQQHASGAKGLWEYLRACDFSKDGEMRVPVLIFDQFEEFFEHSKARQNALTQELADLVSERLPERIRQSLRQIPFRSRTQEQLDWHSAIPVKIILAIRSDRMSLLDEMSSQIQSILHNRFHLKPLDIESAREAIELPAQLPGSEFAVAPFTYDGKAMDTILNYLKNKNDEIESFQLQLLCQKIEKNLKRKKAVNAVVQESDFGGADGIKSILNNYYLEEIADLEEAEQPLARKFIEEGLIVAGRRVGVSEGVEEQSFGITKELLRKLLDSRLIRAENTHLGRSFELSHDTLVAPIMEAFNIRFEEEEREKARQARIEQEKLLKEERKKRQTAVLLAIAGFILSLLAGAGGYYAYQQSQVAKKEKDAAQKAQVRAENTLKQLQRAQLDMAQTYLGSGRSNMDLGRYSQAVEDFDIVLKLRENIPDSILTEKGMFARADSLKSSALAIGGVKKQYDELMEKGNTALQRNDYLTALKNYRDARKLDVNTTDNRRASLKVEEARVQLIPQFKKLVEKAEKFEEAGGCEFAKPEIRRAERIAPYLNTNSIRAELQRLREVKRKCGG